MMGNKFLQDLLNELAESPPRYKASVYSGGDGVETSAGGSSENAELETPMLVQKLVCAPP